MTFVSKMSVFTCKPWENLNWLLVLGHSLLRPTSNNLKNVLPEILMCLVPECPKSSAWFLTPFPPWVWAVKEPGWCMRNSSVAAPILADTDQLWTLLLTCVAKPLLFLLPIYYFLSEEELVHHCHHVLVQINKMFSVLHAVGSAFIVCAVSGTSEGGECTKLGFMLGEHGRTHSKCGCMSEQGQLQPRCGSALT